MCMDHIIFPSSNLIVIGCCVAFLLNTEEFSSTKCSDAPPVDLDQVDMYSMSLQRDD